MKKNCFQAFCVALLPAMIFWFAAMNIFIGNPLDFSFTLAESCIGMSIVAFMIGAIFFSFQMVFIRTKGFELCSLICFLLGCCMWIEGTLFIWQTDTSMGIIASYHSHLGKAIFEIFIFALLFFLAFRYRSIIQEELISISLVLIGTQFLISLFSFFTYDESAFTNKFVEFKQEGKYDFSSQQNVIIFILDGFGETYFSEARKLENGKIEKKFKDFTHFTRALSPNPSTLNGIPLICTGSSIFAKKGRGVYRSHDYTQDVLAAATEEQSLFTGLASLGFHSYIYPIDPCVFPILPDKIKNLQSRDKKLRLSAILADDLLPHTFYRLVPFFVKAQTFRYLHTAQWKMYGVLQRLISNDVETDVPRVNSKLEGDTDTNREDLLISSEAIFREMKPLTVVNEKRFIVHHLHSVHEEGEESHEYDRDKYVHIARCDLQGMADLMALMQKAGVYDNSFIILVGDHGPHLEPEYLRNPILLMKRPGDRHDMMVDNDEYVSLADIAPSVLSYFMGEEKYYSAWNMPETLKKQREEDWNSVKKP
ncbi:MAG: sulfatase-like hydrolase/transferase [Planctomycetia bacterium]|nr:sulfatase-like hydrolase/transferase [Planctomycetia bacterium]